MPSDPGASNARPRSRLEASGRGLAAALTFILVRLSLAPFASLPLVVVLLVPRGSHAYCRTTTCPSPTSFVPTATACQPAGLTSCQADGTTAKNIPLWWKASCVGYSLQKDASKRVTLDQAMNAASGAFARWSLADCGGGAPSIAGEDLGPIACGEVAFSVDGPNQHVIVFRDSAWPYKSAVEQRLGQPSLTIALTTVSFNRDTGEILDADIELNSADHKIVPTDALTSGVYDLESVLTHESGHFLGFAHSPDVTAVMYYQDEGGSARHRALTGDDIDAVCAVYPPGGVRPVDTSVSPSGGVASSGCDPTPRGGQSSACVAPGSSSSSGGCAAASGAAPGWAGWPLLVAMAGLVARRHRARPALPRSGSRRG